MLIAHELDAVLSRDKLNACIIGMFADGMADWEIVDTLPGATLADVVSAPDMLAKGNARRSC